MGQSPAATRAKGGLDLVITNAIILDWWGVVKADIGIRDGRIVGIGKAGIPTSWTASRKAWRSGLHRGVIGRRKRS